MKAFNQKILLLLKRNKTDNRQAAVCNYADNYYGDQVCVIAK